MSLRLKTMLAVVVTVAAMMALLYTVLRVRTLEKFQELESQAAHADVQRALKALDGELAAMDRILRSWSSRDDAYSFAGTGDPSFVASTLTDHEIGELHLSIVAIADSADTLAFAKVFDQGLVNPEAAGAALAANLKRGQPLTLFPGRTASVLGAVDLGGTPMLVVSRQIRKTKESSRPLGTFLIGRTVGSSLEKDLMQLTDLQISLAPAQPVAVQAATHMQSPEAITSHFAGPDKIVSTVVYRDFDGQPVFILTVTGERPYLRQATTLLNDVMVAMIAVGVVIALMVAIAVDRQVVARLRLLGANLREIRELDDLSQRVTTRGHDELSELGRDVNQMLATLESSLERHRAQTDLLNMTRDAIYVVSPAGKICYWNQGAATLYGWPVADAVDRDCAECVQLVDEPGFAALLDETLATGEWLGELVQRTRDGATVTVVSRWLVVHNWLEMDVAVLIANTNITQQKRLEVQMLRTQRLESLGTLASGISHDLNNVLGSIISTIWLLRRQDKAGQFTSMLDTVERSAKRGAEIVRQVLTFARGAEARRLPVKPGPLLLELHAFMRSSRSDTIDMAFEIPDGLWPIIADSTQFHQAILNLSVNACDAMPQAGRLCVKATNLMVNDAFARCHANAHPGPYLQVIVSDTGSGISAELLDKVFDPFFTTKPVGKGTGLGLSTVLNVVKAHDGFLTVDSDVGTGTTFTLYFPAAPDATVTGARDTSPSSPAEATDRRSSGADTTP